MLLFNEYVLVGGMPQAVAAFIDGKKDLFVVDDEKRDIVNLYRDDIGKISSKYKTKVASVFEGIPGLLSRHDKKIVYSDISAGSRTENYVDAFFWLSDSMISNISYRCSDPEAGFSRNEDRASAKCYMGDTGLLISLMFGKKELEKNNLYSLILSGKLSINEGMLHENVIAQMLVAAGYPLYFYTHYSEEKHRNDIEIDFLIPESGQICPIEVKSSNRYTTVSFDKFRQKYGKRIVNPIVIHPANLRAEDGVLRIPSYMTFCL